MTERKMVPINKQYHTMLRELADANHRSMTAQVEWLVAKAWRNHQNTETLIDKISGSKIEFIKEE